MEALRHHEQFNDPISFGQCVKNRGGAFASSLFGFFVLSGESRAYLSAGGGGLSHTGDRHDG